MNFKDLKNSSPEELEAFITTETEMYKTILNRNTGNVKKHFSVTVLLKILFLSAIIVAIFRFIPNFKKIIISFFSTYATTIICYNAVGILFIFLIYNLINIYYPRDLSGQSRLIVQRYKKSKKT